MEFFPFDPDSQRERWRRHLPHWEQPGCSYFVTFRCADSIPREKLEQWKAEKLEFEARHPLPWDATVWADYRGRFLERIERWSDRGYGACVLRRPEIRELVEGALRFFDDRPENRSRRYQLGSCVLMPNHVHLLVRPLQGWKLGQLVHSWKSFTAKQINHNLGTAGPFWIDERFDHLVRNSASLAKFEHYIRMNPTLAGLQDEEFTLIQT